MLYEIAYAYGGMSTSFSISSMMPRQKIPEHSTIDNVRSLSTVLVVEESSAPLDMNIFIIPSSMSGAKVSVKL